MIRHVKPSSDSLLLLFRCYVIVIMMLI